MLHLQEKSLDQEARDFCNKYLHEADGRRYVLGTNYFAERLQSHIEVDYFIDDYTEKKTFLGKPIVKIDEVPRDALTISAVVLGRLVTAIDKLKERQINCIDYFKFCDQMDIGEPYFIDNARLDINKNLGKYQNLFERLADPESKLTFEDILNFRLTSDISYMKEYSIDYDSQYFDKVIDFGIDEVFVDAGGYDGETTLNFISRCPEFKSVHFFEPDPRNLEIARNRLSQHRNINFYQIGLGEEEKVLKFKTGDGSASALDESGDTEIQVNSIDNTVNERVSFIKMDIEGSEIPALRGCRYHIENDHPKLAICCYHKTDDFWRIPEEILSVREDYSIFLRHYSEGLTETVMYFIPQARTV